MVSENELPWVIWVRKGGVRPSEYDPSHLRFPFARFSMAASFHNSESAESGAAVTQSGISGPSQNYNTPKLSLSLPMLRFSFRCVWVYLDLGPWRFYQQTGLHFLPCHLREPKTVRPGARHFEKCLGTVTVCKWLVSGARRSIHDIHQQYPARNETLRRI